MQLPACSWEMLVKHRWHMHQLGEQHATRRTTQMLLHRHMLRSYSMECPGAGTDPMYSLITVLFTYGAYVCNDMRLDRLK